MNVALHRFVFGPQRERYESPIFSPEAEILYAGRRLFSICDNRNSITVYGVKWMKLVYQIIYFLSEDQKPREANRPAGFLSVLQLLAGVRGLVVNYIKCIDCMPLLMVKLMGKHFRPISSPYNIPIIHIQYFQKNLRTLQLEYFRVVKI